MSAALPIPLWTFAAPPPPPARRPAAAPPPKSSAPSTPPPRRPPPPAGDSGWKIALALIGGALAVAAGGLALLMHTVDPGPAPGPGPAPIHSTGTPTTTSGNAEYQQPSAAAFDPSEPAPPSRYTIDNGVVRLEKPKAQYEDECQRYEIARARWEEKKAGRLPTGEKEPPAAGTTAAPVPEIQ